MTNKMQAILDVKSAIGRAAAASVQAGETPAQWRATLEAMKAEFDRHIVETGVPDPEVPLG